MTLISDIAYVLFLVSDIQKAREFYCEKLGLTVSASSYQGAWLEFDIGHGTLIVTNRLSELGGRLGSAGAVVALEVSDLDEVRLRLLKHEIAWRVGPVDASFCRGGIVEDPDGNRIMFHQRKSQAPNKAPEPTTMAVTPRATERVSK